MVKKLLAISLIFLFPPVSRAETAMVTITESESGYCASNLSQGCKESKNRTVVRAIKTGLAQKRDLWYSSAEVRDLAQKYDLVPDEEGNISVPVTNDYPDNIDLKTIAAQYGVPEYVVNSKRDLVTTLGELVLEIGKWKVEQISGK